jgi:hypothetical protein
MLCEAFTMQVFIVFVRAQATKRNGFPGGLEWYNFLASFPGGKRSIRGPALAREK